MKTSLSGRKKVIYDQDELGLRDHNLYGLFLLLQAPGVELVGLTTVSGREWSPRQMPQALRVLELLGRSDVPVAGGAVFPLLNSPARSAAWESLHGPLFDPLCFELAEDMPLPGSHQDDLPAAFDGAVAPGSARCAGTRGRAALRAIASGDAISALPRCVDSKYRDPGSDLDDPFYVPDLPEGPPRSKALGEPAAVFMTRMAQKFPGEIAIVATGPLTNLALACRLDPAFPQLVKELIFVGGRFMPYSRTGLFTRAPNRREANFRHDPEAAHIVLRAFSGAEPGPDAWAAEQRGEMASRFRCGPSEGIPGGYFEPRAPSKGAASSPRCDPSKRLGSAKLICLPRDLTDTIRVSAAMHAAIAKARTPVGRFLHGLKHEIYAKGDALAAALCAEPALVQTVDEVCLDVDLDPHGANYGCLLNWRDVDFAPTLCQKPIRVVTAIDEKAFAKAFVQWGSGSRRKGKVLAKRAK